MLALLLIAPGCCIWKRDTRDSRGSMPSSAPPRLQLKAGQSYTPLTDEVWVNQQDHLEVLADRNRLRALLQ
jgi:hypothetical protein